MLGPKKVITASQHRIANALGPNQSTFRQCDWNPLDSNDNWTLFLNKNVVVRLGFRIYIFCCVYVFPYFITVGTDRLMKHEHAPLQWWITKHKEDSANVQRYTSKMTDTSQCTLRIKKRVILKYPQTFLYIKT